MQIVIVKYISVFCFTLFFRYNNCDQLLTEFNEDGKIRQLSACVARCLSEKKNSSLEDCYRFCTEEITLPPLVKLDYKVWNMELLCRNSTNLAFRISNFVRYDTVSYDEEKNDDNEDETIENSSTFPDQVDDAEENSPKVLILKIYKVNEGLKKQMIYLSNSSIINVGDLNENTTYIVSLAIVNANFEVSNVVENMEFTTLPSTFQPGIIENITTDQFLRHENDNNMLRARIRWQPAEDMTCSYDVLSFLVEKPTDVSVQEIRQPDKLYTCYVENVFIGGKFRVGIKGVNKFDGLIESELLYQEFEAPSCLQWYRNNLTMCAPEEPTGLQVNHTHLSGHKYSISISWNKPNQLPDYYSIYILDLDRTNPDESKINLTGDQTSQYLPSIILNGFEYEVHLTAYSTGGNSSTMVGKHIDVLNIAGKHYALKLIVAIIIPIMCITVASLLVLLVCHRRAKLKRYQERCKYFEELEKKAPVDPNSNFDFPVKTLPTLTSKERLNLLQQQLESKLYINDVMEIDRDNVILLDEVLGEGAFGLVRKGITKLKDGKECEVAVKMLKDNPSIEDITEFRREIDVMKFVGDHPNIVGLIGHCTKNINEMLLLTEYCSRGNLLLYLRSEWSYHQNRQQYHESQDGGSVKKLVDDKQPESIFNFDISFIDKISISYKNINDHRLSNTIESPDLTNLHSPVGDENQQDNNQHTANIVVNNSYELNGPCTNSCKCQVDIIPKTECLKTNDFDTNNKYNKIEIKGCQCRVRRLSINENGSQSAIENHGYYKLISPKPLDNTFSCGEEKLNYEAEDEDSDRLTSGDLLRMAKQIALGMEFLSKNKVVHRDVAARNVLVCENKSVKIADFGLSRDIYQENIYKKTGNGKLPIKWLALESMTHQIYTSQSDVWSYGVLLYEIVTLGGTPYPLIPTNRLMQLLKAGYRMEKPKNCSEALYELMLSCWRTKPAERPTFTEICRILDDLLYNASEDETIDLSLMEHVTKRSKSSSEESYLKPI